MKRRRVWRWLLASLGVVLAVLAAIVWDVHRRAEAVLVRERGVLDNLLLDLRARPAARAPLEGPGVEGNAWDVYAAVLPAVEKLPPDEAASLVEGELEASDDEGLGILLLKHAALIQSVERGLRCLTSDPGYRYEDGGDMDMPLIQPMASMSKLFSVGIRHHGRLGRGREVLDWAALGLGLAQEAGRRSGSLGLLIQARLETAILDALPEVFGSHTFAATDLDRFSRRLDALDAGRVQAEETWEVEEVMIRSTLLAGSGNYFWRGVRPGWRNAFSLDVLQARLAAKIPRLVEEGRATVAGSTQERTAAAQAFYDRWREEDSNPVVGVFGSTYRDAPRYDVHGLMKRSLLRVAVALARFEAERAGYPSTLEEMTPAYLARVPSCAVSGLPLGYAEGRVWSPGEDGVDNGGTSNDESPTDPDTHGTDLVWTVNRRK